MDEYWVPLGKKPPLGFRIKLAISHFFRSKLFLRATAIFLAAAFLLGMILSGEKPKVGAAVTLSTGYIGSGDYAGEDIIINGHVMIAGGTYNWKNLTISPTGILDSQGASQAPSLTLNLNGNLTIYHESEGVTVRRGELRTDGNETVARPFTHPNGADIYDARGGENGGDLTIIASSVLNDGIISANGFNGEDAIFDTGSTLVIGGRGGGHGGRISITAQHFSTPTNQPALSIGIIRANGGNGGNGAESMVSAAGYYRHIGRPGDGINDSVMSAIRNANSTNYSYYFDCNSTNYNDWNGYGGCPGYNGQGGSGGSGETGGANDHGGGGGGGSGGIITLDIYNLENKGSLTVDGGNGGRNHDGLAGGVGGQISFGKDFSRSTSSGFPGSRDDDDGGSGGGGSGGLVDIEEGSGLAKSGLSIQKTILKGDVNTDDATLDSQAQIASNIGPGEIVTVRLEVVNSAGQENVTITDEILTDGAEKDFLNPGTGTAGYDPRWRNATGGWNVSITTLPGNRPAIQFQAANPSLPGAGALPKYGSAIFSYNLKAPD